ncbi:hypothetical protein ACHAW6_015909 [Cyclotella cf. meneghiniana]
MMNIRRLGQGVTRRGGPDYKFLFIFFVGQALLLLAISFSFQFTVMHNMNMDQGQHSPRALNNAADAENVSSASAKVGGTQIDPPRQTESQDQVTRPIIAYTVTITGCGKNDKRYSAADAMGLINQGAAVLAHSIALAHAKSNKYGYQMYALVHPVAKECSANLPKLGYTVLVRNTPFDKGDIRQQFLRENIDKASCCGEKEFIKLYAYTLVDHPVAVILDLDSLVLQPLDDLFDAIIEGDALKEETVKKLPIHDKENAKIPKKIDAFYTKDYNMINAGNHEVAGVQGGFLMLRPSESIFDEYIDLVLEGNYIQGKGWGGKYGFFFGGAQVQGICAYYYSGLHPNEGVELNRCRINSMVDSPVFEKGSDANGKCRDGRDICEDCRETDVSDILSSHFTICGKPWNCSPNSQKLCSQLHGEWFRIRRHFEETRTDGMGYVPQLEGTYEPEIFHGYCTNRDQYVQIKV